MRGTSHHVQGVDVTGKHCYACHWESTAEGRINELYHKKHASKKSPKSGNGKVDLVIWSAGKRPTLYKPYSSAVTFQAAAIATSREREEVAKISRHCLSCHSDQNNDTRPFAGDNKTPRQYAWDRQSIASRYAQKETVPWGKYATASTNNKSRVVKALSAHGNAAANQGGWSSSTGYDGEIPVTRGGSNAKNVECFDCHNSHGSTVQGITSSYQTFDGTLNGGILKQTLAGKGGYRMSYQPSYNPDNQSKNPYNAGAGLCFDCHETALVGMTPWGYSSTFGVTQHIIGYKDTLRFGSGSKGSTSRYANRESRTEVASSHLKAGQFLNYSAHNQINGLCTPCHDPHGISRTLGDKGAYAVPLLKGTWLTSPYREDGPPSSLPLKWGSAMRGTNDSEGERSGNSNFNAANREANANFGKGRSGAPREPMAGMKYNVDRNTFGGDNRITEDEGTFGGICLKCHPISKINGDNKSDRIHRAIKGWGNNKEHSFPCSKCHQPHNSGLPRLMQTNCFEEGPSSLRENSGLPWLPYKKSADLAKSKDPADTQNSSSKNKKAIVGCHVRQFGGTAEKPGNKPPDDAWNEKNKW